MTTLLGQGIYTLPEAAKLAQLKPVRAREWFMGRPTSTTQRPVFYGDYEPVDGDYAVSFHDLIDLVVAGWLREHGVALPILRRLYVRMQHDLDTPHPFCRRELLSDGPRVLTRGLDEQGREGLGEALTLQKVFPEVLLPCLKTIDYDPRTALARRWHIAEMVVVDPALCLGKPVVEAAGIPTHILASAYHANGRNADLVADWYNVGSGHVLAAVRFEDGLAA